MTIADLEPAERDRAEELVRLLLDDEPTGEEPLLAVLEYAARALVGARVRPVFDEAGAEPRWIAGT